MMPIWLAIVLGVALLGLGVFGGVVVINAINSKSLDSAKSKTKEILAEAEAQAKVIHTQQYTCCSMRLTGCQNLPGYNRIHMFF